MNSRTLLLSILFLAQELHSNNAHKFLQKSPIGRIILKTVDKPLTKLCGFMANSSVPFPYFNIPNFLKECQKEGCPINLEQFQAPENGYKNLQALFTRKFREGLRPFLGGETAFNAPAEGMLSIIKDVNVSDSFYVKNKKFTIEKFLDSQRIYEPFTKKWGLQKSPSILIFRLRIGDYHRFHMPIDGKIIEEHEVSGALRSVRPFAFTDDMNPFVENYRRVFLCQDKKGQNFALVAVGAFCVSSVERTAAINQDLKKGDEVGLFKMGSTIVVITEQEYLNFNQDLNDATKTELFCQLGTQVGNTAVKSSIENIKK